MAKILLQAGVKFSPKDIDTKAIRTALNKELTSRVKLTKLSIGRQAKNTLQADFATIPLIIQNSRFGRSAGTQLRNSFARIPFLIEQVGFSPGAIRRLQRSVQNLQVQITPRAAPGAGARSAAGSAIAGQKALGQQTAIVNQQLTRQGAVAQNVSQKVSAYKQQVNSAAKGNVNFGVSSLKSTGIAAKFGETIVKITARFVAYLVSLRAILLVQQAFTNSLKVIFEFDNALQDLQKILQTTPEGLAEVARGLFDVAVATGRSVSDVAESFGVFRRAIDDTNEALVRTQAALISTNISELTIAESTALVTSSLNIFTAEITDSIDALDILSAVSDKAATTTTQLGRGVLRSGAAAQAVGISFKQLTAIIAATQEATQLGGAQIGSALKTIFARIAASSVQLRQQANAFGANVTAADSVFETLNKLANIFPKLNREQKAQITQIVAGKRRFTEFNALLSSFNRINELSVNAQGASGTAIQKNQAELDKLSTAVQQVRTEFSRFIVGLTGTDEGAEGIITIRNALAGVIELLGSVGKSANSIVDAVKEFEGFGSLLFGTFAGIISVGLFKIGPSLIAKLIGGMRNFLNTAAATGKVIQAQGAALGAVATAETQVLSKEKLIVTERQKELNLLTRALQVEQKLAGIRRGGGGVAGGAASAQVGVLQRQFGKIRTISEQGIGAFNRGLGRLRGGLNKAGQFFQNNAIATAIGLSAVATGLTNAGVKLQDSEDATERFAGSMLKATGEATNLGVQVGLLAGPLAGLGVATLSAILSIRKAKEQAEATQIIAAEGLEEAITGIVTEGEAFAIAGAEGVAVFKELAVATDNNKRAIADEFTFRTRLNDLIVSGNTTLAASVILVNAALIDFDKQIKANARGINLRKEFDKLTRQLRVETATLRLKLEGGQFASEFRDVIGSTAELETLFDRFVKKGGEIEGSLTKQTKLIEAAAAARKGEFGEALSILNTNLITTAELQQQNKELATARATLKDISETEGARSLPAQKELLENINQRVEKEKENLERLEAAKKAGEAIATIDQDIARSKESIVQSSRTAAALEGSINDFTDKLSQAESKVLELKKQRVQVAEDEVKLVADIEKILRKQVVQADNVALRIQIGTKNLRAQNDAAQENLRTRAQQIQAELRGGTLQQRQAAATASIQVRGQESVRAKQAEINEGVRRLNSLASLAARRGLKEQANVLKQAAVDARAAGDAQIEELTRKASLEVDLKLISTNRQNIERAESALQEFRLNNLRQLINREQDASNRRIDLIKQLQETAGGRRFLQNELSPQPGLQRQLGTFGAAIAEELNKQANAAIAGIIQEFDELRVGATSSVSEIRRANEQVNAQEIALANLRRSGASADEVAAAEKQLRKLQDTLKDIANSGEDAFAKLKFLQEAQSKIIQTEETKNTEIREISLERAKKAAESVKKAEDALLSVRNKIPALNSKIIDSQRSLAAANVKVEDSTNSLVQANQNLTDEQFKLNFNIELAGFKARQSAGAFGSAQEAIDGVAAAFKSAVGSVNASTKAILEARRAALQEELSIVQNQLSAVEGLALQAALATDEQLATLTDQISIATQIASGAIGAGDVAGIDPEILSGISGLTDVIPGLREALRNLGAERLGIDPGVFQSFEDELVEISVGIAETGRAQLESTEKQVTAAVAQLEEARQQKQISQQNLENSILAKEAALSNVAQQAGVVAISRANLSAVNRQTNRTLQEFRPGRIASEEAAAALNFIRTEIAKQTEEIKLSKDSNLKQLDTLTQELEQAKAIKDLAKQTAEQGVKTAEATGKTAENTGLLAGDTASTAVNTNATATNTNDTKVLVSKGNVLLQRIADNTGNNTGASLQGLVDFITNSAAGTLSSGEIAGILSAAQREKKAMPAGSNLMLANTSETVLTNKQFKRFRTAARGNIPNAAGGFGDTAGIEAMIGQVSQALQGLRNSTAQVAAAVSAQGPVQVNVDTQRSVTVNGLQELPAAIQRVVEDRIGGTPTAAEVVAIRESVTDVLNRLRENGLEDFT